MTGGILLEPDAAKRDDAYWKRLFERGLLRSLDGDAVKTLIAMRAVPYKQLWSGDEHRASEAQALVGLLYRDMNAGLSTLLRAGLIASNGKPGDAFEFVLVDV